MRFPQARAIQPNHGAGWTNLRCAARVQFFDDDEIRDLRAFHEDRHVVDETYFTEGMAIPFAKETAKATK